MFKKMINWAFLAKVRDDKFCEVVMFAFIVCCNYRFKIRKYVGADLCVCSNNVRIIKYAK